MSKSTTLRGLHRISIAGPQSKAKDKHKKTDVHDSSVANRSSTGGNKTGKALYLVNFISDICWRKWCSGLVFKRWSFWKILYKAFCQICDKNHCMEMHECFWKRRIMYFKTTCKFCNVSKHTETLHDILLWGFTQRRVYLLTSFRFLSCFKIDT